MHSRTSQAFVTKAAMAVGAPGRRRLRNPAVVILLVVAVLATACGARVGPYLGAGGGADVGGANSNNAGPTAGAGATATTAPAAAGQTAGQTAGGGGGGGGGGGNPSVAPATSFSYTPQAEAAACTGSAGNTASAPGVTPSAIELGNVSGITGPLQGSFQQGAQAVNALFDAVNAAGGICGRKLDVGSNSLDDQQNTSTNKADVDQLIAKPVFAFVGSTSDADGGGVPDMEAANVPDYGFAIDCSRSESTTYFSVDGGSCYQPAGPGKGPYAIGDGAFALAQAQGYLPKKMAFLSYSIAISAQAAQQFAYVYQHSFGGSICYTDYSISPVTASLESDVAQMQSAGCQGVYTTLDVTGNAKLLQAMQQQNFSMPYVATTFDGYTPTQISTAGQSAAQGLDVTIPFIPLNENQPMDVMYEQQLQKYVPGASPSGFGFLAWLAGQMFIYNLLQAGRNPTRASLLAALNSLHNYTAGGAVGAYTPSSHSVDLCIMDVQVKGSDFVRRAPSSGLYCGGKLVQASP